MAVQIVKIADEAGRLDNPSAPTRNKSSQATAGHCYVTAEHRYQIGCKLIRTIRDHEG